MKTIFTLRAALLLAFILALSVQGHAQFNAGTLVVTKVGDGTTPLAGTTAPVALFEFAKTGTGQTGTSKVAFSATGADKLTVFGTTNTSGQVTLSADGKFLVVSGYDQPSATLATTATAGNKVVTRISRDGTVDYTTKFPSIVNVYSAVSNDGGQYWLNGTSNSMGYLTHGQTTATNLVHASGPSRAAGIFNNQLFSLRGFDNLYAYRETGNLANGLPTSAVTTPATATMTTAVSLSPSLGANGFVFFDLDPTKSWNGTGLDVVYLSNTNSGLEKYYWNGNDWKIVNSQYNYNVSITNGGSGYTAIPTVTIGRGLWSSSGGNYILNDYVVTISGSTRRSYLVTTAGTPGTAAPTHTTGTGTGAGGTAVFTFIGTSAITATAVLTGDVVTDVIITQGHQPATGIPPVTFSAPEAGSTATATGSFPNNKFSNPDFTSLSQITGAINSAGKPVIYAVSGNGTATANKLLSITDNSAGISSIMSGTTIASVVLATAQANYAFRGVAFAPAITKTWIGQTSTDVLEGSNWADGTVPAALDFINIPAGTPFSPVISADTTIASATIAAGARITVNEGKVLNITVAITNNGDLILKSSALGTASLTSPTTVANVTQQRYLSSNQRGWRLLSNPLSTKTFPDLAAASNIIIGAGYTGQYDSVANTWSSGTGFGNMATQQAYKVFITGLLGEAPSYLTGPSNVTFINKGTAANTAPATVNTTAETVGKFYLVANPYTAPVSVASILSASTGLSNTISYYNPDNGSEDVKLKFGGYNTPTVSGAAGSATDVVIPPMGAFFVQAQNNTAGTINVPKSAIFTGTALQTATYAHKSTQAKVASTNALKVEVSSGNTYYDTVALQFKAVGDAGSNVDFGKLPNTILDAYTIVGTQKMAVSELELEAQTIPVGITSTIQKSYTFKVIENTIPAGFEAVLVDNVLNTSTVLSTGINYNFTIDGNPATQGEARFAINLKTAGSLGVNTNELEAKIQVYPNPSRGEFNISNTYEGAATIEISSLNGQLIHSQKLNSGTTTIQTKSWATGVYILKAINNGSQTTKKLIIK